MNEIAFFVKILGGTISSTVPNFGLVKCWISKFYNLYLWPAGPTSKRL